MTFSAAQITFTIAYLILPYSGGEERCPENNPPFSQFEHNPFSSVNHLSLYSKRGCSDLKERGGERERERVKIIFWAISAAPLRDGD